MIKLSNILLEGLTLYKIEILIKTSSESNQVYIYNEIRGIKDVVVVTVEQNDYLKSKDNDKFHYSLLKMKYLSGDVPKEAINKIKLDCLVTNKIDGLLQFIPRYGTITKVGEY